MTGVQTCALPICLSGTLEPPKIITCGAFATVIISSKFLTSLSTILPAHAGNTCVNPTIDGCDLCALGNESNTQRSNNYDKIDTIIVFAAFSGVNS